MTQQLLQRESAFSAEADGWAARLVKNLSAQDWFIAIYFGLLFIAVATGTGPGRVMCVERIAVDFTCFATGIVLTRGGILRYGSFANGMVYRLTVFLCVFLSYFQLRHILPAVSSRALDADILA